MWNVTARVGRSRALVAGADQAAALLRTAGPWALMPGAGHAFTVPNSPAGLGRLICLVGAPPTGAAGGILEVVDETPGQLVRVRSRSTNPVGKLAATLAVAPDRGRLRLRLDVEAGCLRPEQTFVEARWRRWLGSWLAALADALEGRAPWPSHDMPADLQRAWRANAALTDHDLTEVEGVVPAALGVVWAAVRAPTTQRGAMEPVYTGYVPGTPPGQAGEMIYQLLPYPHDQLVAGIYLVADLADGHWVQTCRVGRPRVSTLTSIEAAGDGTKITLTGSVPAGSSAEISQQVAAGLRARMNAYQELLGESA